MEEEDFQTTAAVAAWPMELSAVVDHAGTRRSLRDRGTEPGDFAGDK